ncbi:GTPase Era [bacterium 3DAC]|nr:GTPase Era [Dictyoglomota bacterium]UZN23563.1 GTPase Era [bacterium 3DAC]
MEVKEGFRSGFAGFIGRPNVGKSTLMNTILGWKLSIVSPKPQTTRYVIRGVKTTEDYQLIMVDLPGIHKPFHKLGEIMTKTALKYAKDMDVNVMIVDASTRKPGKGDIYIAEYLQSLSVPRVLVVNKIDLVDRNEVDDIVSAFVEGLPAEFGDVVAVSALKGWNIDALEKTLAKYLPEGPLFFPPEMGTDVDLAIRISDIIREKILYLTHEEVPHSTAVIIDKLEDKGDIVVIYATIYVEKDSQKPIIIGKGGRRIKEIGTQARQELELILGKKVYLELWVKVKEDWRGKLGVLTDLGFTLPKES